MIIKLKPPTATGEVRLPDPMGDGAFGAPRDDRLHVGVDFLADPFDTITSPCDGVVSRLGQCYADDPTYRLVEIDTGEMLVRVLYVDPSVRRGTAVAEGTPIGLAQNIAARYGCGMQNHIHLDARLVRGVLIGKGARPPDRVFIDPTFLFDYRTTSRGGCIEGS